MFHFNKIFGFFVGKLYTNEFHKHFAIQISVSVMSTMSLTIKGEGETTGNIFFINSRIEHKLLSADNQLTILINPLSSIGHQLYLKFEQSEIPHISKDFTNQLISNFSGFEKNIQDFNEFCSALADSLNIFKCSCKSENHPKDDRIIKVLEAMERSVDKVYSMEEAAALCFLSPSHFLHLFKEKTGLNFRRYQLWNKLVKSLPYLTTNSITDTAHTFGFTDSSHYTRTFKETFGVKPKFMFGKE